MKLTNIRIGRRASKEIPIGIFVIISMKEPAWRRHFATSANSEADNVRLT